MQSSRIVIRCESTCVCGERLTNVRPVPLCTALCALWLFSFYPVRYCCCHPVLFAVFMFALLIGCVAFVNFHHPPCSSPIFRTKHTFPFARSVCMAYTQASSMCWHAFIFKHCYALYMLTVDSRVCAIHAAYYVRICVFSLLLRIVGSFRIQTASVRIKYVCSRCDSVSSEWSANSDGRHLPEL